MVQRNLNLDDWCWWVELLATRGDLSLFYGALSEGVHHALLMLLGVNHIYHPGFKWMNRLIAELTIQPQNLGERVQTAFRSEPLTALGMIRDLTLETYDLVDKHLPQVDTHEARTAFLRQRPQIATLPAGILSK